MFLNRNLRRPKALKIKAGLCVPQAVLSYNVTSWKSSVRRKTTFFWELLGTASMKNKDDLIGFSITNSSLDWRFEYYCAFAPGVPLEKYFNLRTVDVSFMPWLKYSFPINVM